MKKVIKTITLMSLVTSFFLSQSINLAIAKNSKESKKNIVNVNNKDKLGKINKIDSKNSKNIEIISVGYEDSVFFANDTVSCDVVIKNSDNTPYNVYIGYSLISPIGEIIDLPVSSTVVDAYGESTINMDYKVEKEIVTGPYSAIFSIWDRDPTVGNAKKISSIKKTDILKIFNEQDDFDYFNQDFWFKRNDFTLGRSLLKSDNVSIDEKGLNIVLPANTFEGGEIQTKSELGFGSYEIKMKLPNAPSSITGFFLYKEPDFENEIDIELYNDPKSRLLLTTYANGIESNVYKGDLGFDPTLDYNIYRIDYYESQVSFYINDKLIKSWNKGLSNAPMKLMVNAWYPRWLDGNMKDNDEKLSVDWIRY